MGMPLGTCKHVAMPGVLSGSTCTVARLNLGAAHDIWPWSRRASSDLACGWCDRWSLVGRLTRWCVSAHPCQIVERCAHKSRRMRHMPKSDVQCTVHREYAEQVSWQAK